MSKRKSKPTGNDSDGYEVGYRKPPVQTRFQEVQSGNPTGRRKGVRNLKTDVKRTLATLVKVKEGGRTRKKSTQESALMLLREKALRGDARALERLLELAMRFNNDTAEAVPTQPLAADDQAILDAYVAEFTSTELNSPSSDTFDDSTEKPHNVGNKIFLK